MSRDDTPDPWMMTAILHPTVVQIVHHITLQLTHADSITVCSTADYGIQMVRIPAGSILGYIWAVYGPLHLAGSMVLWDQGVDQGGVQIGSILVIF